MTAFLKTHNRLLDEQLFPVVELPDRLPPGLAGKPLNRWTVRSWYQRGLRGGTLRLETVRIGGRILTSCEAVARFLDGCNRDGDRLEKRGG